MTNPSFDASFAGKSKRRIRGKLIVLLAFTITLAAVVANVALRRVVEDGRRAEVLLLQLHGFAYRLSAFEWQAISERGMSSKIVAGVQDTQDEMTQTMGRLEQLDANAGNLRLVRQTYNAYYLAMNEEFSLIKTGNLSQAHQIDEERVDPAFDALTDALSSTAAAYRTQANQMEQRGFFGSILILLLTIVTIGVLVWQIQKAQAATESAVVEQRALTRGQAELRLFADNVPSMTVSFDENLRCAFANKRYADFFGFDGTDIIGKHVREILGEKVYSEVESHYAQVLQGRPVTYQRTFELQDGKSRYLEVTLAPDIGHQGKVLGCFAVAHDITERKKAEGRIVHLSRVYAVLSGINSAIVRIPSRQALFDEACRIAVEHGGFGMVWIGLFDPKTLDVTPAAWAGFEADDEWAALKSTTRDIPQGQGSIGRAIREKRPVIVNDMTLDASVGGLRRKVAIERGYRSAIALPLLSEEDVIGTLALFAKEVGYFNDAEVTLLTELAGDISFALEHMARQQKIEKLARIRAVMGEINAVIVRIRDRQALFQEVCRIAAEHGNFTSAWIGMLDRASQVMSPAAWVGLDAELLPLLRFPVDVDGPEARGTIARALRSKRPVWENDFEADADAGYTRRHMIQRGYRSAISLPLLVDGEAQGVFVLYAREHGFFTEEEVGMLTELAADVSFAMQSIASQERLDYLSYYDPLTGLANRTLFLDRAGQQMRSRGGEPLMVALILLDLERFRNINETFGRQGGDEVLKMVARRIESAFPTKDYLARIGADIFGVVIRGIRDAAAAVHALEDQILGCFREPYQLNDTELRVAAKAGIAVFPGDGADADTLFKNAEAALKKARGSGERYLFYAADMNARAAHALSLETRLRKAVEARQFVLHYQPKVELASGRICGLEALIRWNDPETGLVAPGTFIPLLEETGLILEVGKWALVQALAQHQDWAARGCTVPRIAVNVSAIQLQQKDFADMVVSVIQQAGGTPEALELEITESLLMADVEASVGKLSILQELGLHIAMDDFGTGYSSLSYMTRLPINLIKIDRSFIKGVAGSPQDMAIVTTVIALAHSLNLRVVAEGVETEEQSRLLRLLKCDEAQGYLFSKPLPAAEIEPLLREPAPGTRERGSKAANKP